MTIPDWETRTAPDYNAGVTPEMVAGYIVEHPYYGRDQQLAEGWLVMIDAVKVGDDPVAKLQQFVSKVFLNGNNNGVPLTEAEYRQPE